MWWQLRRVSDGVRLPGRVMPRGELHRWRGHGRRHLRERHVPGADHQHLLSVYLRRQRLHQ